jgi:ABC-type sulfate transport system permease component
VSALAEGAQDGAALSAAAWAVVAGALFTSLWFMVRAFQEAKTAISRREEGERAKQQEDEEKEEARKAKIKQMFERL